MERGAGAGFKPVEGWGKLPPGYRYVEAAGVAVDSRDNVYVFCRGGHPVIVFDLYISDGYGNSRVHKYDPRGRYLFSWGEPGTDPGCFNLPHNIVTDAEGLVYVADRENHRVQIFDGGGRYLSQWNNLHRPCGLFAARRNGAVFYVGELGAGLAVNAGVPNIGNRVSILSVKGKLVARIGDRFGGEAPGQFVAPHGVATDSRGDVYVAEVSYTVKGRHENPPREIRSLQKFARKG